MDHVRLIVAVTILFFVIFLSQSYFADNDSFTVVEQSQTQEISFRTRTFAETAENYENPSSNSSTLSTSSFRPSTINNNNRTTILSEILSGTSNLLNLNSTKIGTTQLSSASVTVIEAVKLTPASTIPSTSVTVIEAVKLTPASTIPSTTFTPTTVTTTQPPTTSTTPTSTPAMPATKIIPTLPPTTTITTTATTTSISSEINLISNNNSETVKSGCVLPQLDPWDPSIEGLIDVNYHPMKGCKPTAEHLTTLENGTLKSVSKNESQLCWYRCLESSTDNRIRLDQWRFLNNSAVPACDIVETQCNTSSANVTYRRMHLQIVPDINRINKKNSASEPYRPSVMILVFDSVARSSAIRSIPETIQVLIHKYKAFDFRGLNKVGGNSAPNAYGFLSGIRIEELPPSDSSRDETLPSEKPDFCRKYLENSTYIGWNFTNAGYVSLMAEDWASGAFNWPGCYGFDKKPVTHSMKPFHLRLDGGLYLDEMMRIQMRQQQCRESYHPIMEFQEYFLNAYPVATPKFSIIWISNLAHDNLGGLFHVDKYFANFFRKQHSRLRNSFVFLMGDHGMNFGKIRETKVGQTENGNPMLFLAIPEVLAQNKQLTDSLRKNSEERLVSQFDVYTTLLDIVAVAPRTNWTDFSVHDWTKEGVHPRQSSILRPLDISRNCSFMHISETYCICETYEQPINKTNETVIAAAKFLSKELMKTIKQKSAHDICADLNFKEVIRASFKETNHKNGTFFNYKVTFVVDPSGGSFQANVKKLDQGFQLLSPKIMRISSYGNTSYCTNDPVLRPICYCRGFMS